MPNLAYLGPTAGDAARVADFLERRRDALSAHGLDIQAPGARGVAGRGRRFMLSAGRLAPPGPDSYDLAADRGTRLVLGLQPLQARLSAAWADEVVAGLATPFDTWLSATLADPEPYEWLLRPERAVQAWTEAVGARRVRIVVVGAPRRTVRLLCRALGLPASALRPGALVRGLTAAEAELVRGVNETARAGHWPEAVRERYVAAAVRALQSSGRSRAATVPRAAYDDLAEVAASNAEAIRGLEVRTFGDPAPLGEPPTVGNEPPLLTTQAAARAVAAVIHEAGATAATGPAGATTGSRSPLVREARPRDLLAELRRRVRLTDRDT